MLDSSKRREYPYPIPSVPISEVTVLGEPASRFSFKALLEMVDGDSQYVYDEYTAMKDSDRRKAMVLGGRDERRNR